MLRRTGRNLKSSIAGPRWIAPCRQVSARRWIGPRLWPGTAGRLGEVRLGKRRDGMPVVTVSGIGPVGHGSWTVLRRGGTVLLRHGPILRGNWSILWWYGTGIRCARGGEIASCDQGEHRGTSGQESGHVRSHVRLRSVSGGDFQVGTDVPGCEGQRRRGENLPGDFSGIAVFGISSHFPGKTGRQSRRGRCRSRVLASCRNQEFLTGRMSDESLQNVACFSVAGGHCRLLVCRVRPGP